MLSGKVRGLACLFVSQGRDEYGSLEIFNGGRVLSLKRRQGLAMLGFALSFKVGKGRLVRVLQGRDFIGVLRGQSVNRRLMRGCIIDVLL